MPAKKEPTIYERKVAQAGAYLERYGNTQKARHAAAQRGDETIDSRQWATAVRRHAAKRRNYDHFGHFHTCKVPSPGKCGNRRAGVL